MKQSDDNKFIPMTTISAGKGRQVRPDVYYYTNQMVNLVLIGDPDGPEWVLIDAGMPRSANAVIRKARSRFPLNDRPSAIILTHGHFDHTGSIVRLIEQWDVPVYAHPLEFPYLTGQMSYPDPDTTVEGGLLAKISSIYPHDPIDISPALVPLPEDGSLPDLEGWRWIHTPGHSPGHVSFFRDSDRTLIAGDAFVTVKADSLYRVLVQKKEVNGPPVYLTTDWEAAKQSVIKLAALEPEYAITGHGSSMQGEALRKGLQTLVEDFDTMALPSHGRYVDNH